MPSATPPHLNIAIIGGGPGGLGSAIALSSLPNTTITLYEAAPELREIGAGIRIGYNCWKVLDLLGAADGVKGHVKVEVGHRNGLTGEVLKVTRNKDFGERKTMRVRRTRLQRALREKVGEGVVKLGRKLVQLEDLGEGKGVRLRFEDGGETEADLVIGGDGIRSVRVAQSCRSRMCVSAGDNSGILLSSSELYKSLISRYY